MTKTFTLILVKVDQLAEETYQLHKRIIHKIEWMIRNKGNKQTKVMKNNMILTITKKI